MTRGGTLIGRILDADGKPLVGVQVAIDDIVFLQADTDAGGRFRVEHMPPGTWPASVNVKRFDDTYPTFSVTVAEGKVSEIEQRLPR